MNRILKSFFVALFCVFLTITGVLNAGMVTAIFLETAEEVLMIYAIGVCLENNDEN